MASLVLWCCCAEQRKAATCMRAWMGLVARALARAHACDARGGLASSTLEHACMQHKRAIGTWITEARGGENHLGSSTPTRQARWLDSHYIMRACMHAPTAMD
jgi:hypothetical protein